MKLTDKVAIVTGGSGGLGGAIVRVLAGEGARVLITDVDVAGGTALAQQIDATFVRHDVTDEAAWTDVVGQARAMSPHGRVDILVNAAGIEGDLANSGLSTSLAEWRKVIGINLDGTFLGCREVMPLMIEAGKGAIVNISSIVSGMGTPSGLAYGASKAGVEQLTRSMALIGARNGSRVRCNSVHPGVIQTRMTDNIIAEFAKSQGVDLAQSTAVVSSLSPYGVRGAPDDVAQMVLYLVSDEAWYVTGSAFKIDGGWSVASAG